MSPGVDFRIDCYVIKDVNKEPLGSGVLMENPNLFTALKNISEQFPLLLLSVFIFERSRENNSETSMARGSEIDPNDGSTLMIESRRVCPIFVVVSCLSKNLVNTSDFCFLHKSISYLLFLLE